jgi:hypothetical protein
MVPASPVTGRRRVVLTAVFVLSLSVVSVRGAICESIAVIPTTGDVGPALLASATDNLRELCAGRGHGQPPAELVRGVVADEISGRDHRTILGSLGVDLLLVSKANAVPDGIDLELAFFHPDAGEVCAQSRRVSRASALPQLRAVAGRALDLLAEGSCRPPPEAEAAPPPVIERTSRIRMKAFVLSFMPTMGLTALGLGLTSVALNSSNLSDEPGTGLMISGTAIAGLGVSVGPSLGHFYSGNARYGWIGTGGRLALTGAGLTLALGGGSSLCWSTEYCEPDDDDCCPDQDLAWDRFRGGLALCAFGALWALVDIVLTPILVRDPRRKHPAGRKIEAAVIPTAWRSPSGDSAFGLAVVSAF